MPESVLHLLVQAGGDRYALEASAVTEVVPLVRLKALPGAPKGTAGLMNYRGAAVPVVDLALLVTGTPTPATADARIVVVRHGGADDLVGLLVPAARDTARLDPDRFVDGGLRADGAPYLGEVLATPEGVVQRVTIGALLGEELRAALARRGAAA